MDAAKHRVLSISDTHAPYHHQDVIDFLSDVVRDFKPTIVVHTGDLVDNHSFSVHPKEPDLYGPGHEYDAAKVFIKELQKLFPKMLICFGNHDFRVNRIAVSAGIPSRMILDFKQLFEMPDSWRVADHWIVEGVRYLHGDGASGRNATWKLMQDYRCSIVHGHCHSFPQVIYSKCETNLIWGMNNGCLVDLNSLAFSYGQKYANKGVLGCGVVLEGESAYFVRMPVNK